MDSIGECGERVVARLGLMATAERVYWRQIHLCQVDDVWLLGLRSPGGDWCVDDLV
jgi:hypothetical protein